MENHEDRQVQGFPNMQGTSRRFHNKFGKVQQNLKEKKKKMMKKKIG